MQEHQSQERQSALLALGLFLLQLSGTTDSTGKATGTGTSPSTVANGWTYQAQFAGDNLYNSANSPIGNHNTIKHATLLAFQSLAPSVPWSTGTSFPVILTDSSKGGRALAGKTITFTDTGVINVANKITDSAGKATGTGISHNTVANGWTYNAYFAGDSLYTGSSPSTHSYNTLKHSTSLTLAVSPASVHQKGSYSVSGTLIDTVTSTALASKTITFTATSPITISPHNTNTAGQYSVTGLVAPSTPGNYNIQSHFGGDSL